MLRGVVLDGDEARIVLRLRGCHGATEEVEAVIDTGFTDEMTAESAMIDRLDLTYRHLGRYVLADGRVATARIYQGEILWNAEWREVTVVQTESDCLVGMRLLRGHRLTIDVIDGGDITVEALPSAS